MWKYNEDFDCWSITKTSGFLTLTFDLYRPFKEGDIYRLSVAPMSESFRDIPASNFEEAKLSANELIYDALRWNN